MNKIRFTLFFIVLVSIGGYYLLKSDDSIKVNSVNYKYSGIKIDDITLYDKNNNIVRLEELFNGKKSILIFRYSELNCASCYKAVLNILKDINIVVISSYNSNRIFNIFQDEMNLNLKYYNDKSLSFCKQLDDLNIPYFCVLTEEKELSDIYFPKKKHTRDTKKYLKMVLSKI